VQQLLVAVIGLEQEPADLHEQVRSIAAFRLQSIEETPGMQARKASWHLCSTLH